MGEPARRSSVPRLLLAAGLGTSMVAAGCGSSGRAAPPSPTTPPPTTSPSGTAPGSFSRYMTDTSDGAVTKAYGYNLVDVGTDKATIDALPSGQRALVWLGGYDGIGCRFSTADQQLAGAVDPLAGDPKVAGFYLADEADDALPAFGGHCPDVAAQVTARSQLVHQLDPGPFTYEVVTEPANYAAFARATDVLGADPYPCRVGLACDWSAIPRYVAALHAAHVSRFWGVLQAFSDQTWRYPTAAELSRMIGQWDTSGWNGEQTYAWSNDGQSLSDHPELLATLRAFNLGAAGTPSGVSGPPGGPQPTPTAPLTKVLVIVDENHGAGEVLPSGMPYLSGLADQYGHATSYSDITHPSLPNYLAIFSGSSFNDPQDCSPAPGCTYPGPSVFGEAYAAGRSAKSYEQSMPHNCATRNSGNYDVNHNPWVYIPSEAALCQTDDVPLGTPASGALASDIANGSLPTVGLVTPDLIADAHNGTLADADGFLRQWIPALTSGPDWKAGRLAIAITFDEGDGGEVVPFVLLSPSLHHVVVTTPLDHFALSRFVTDVAGIAPLGRAAGAADLATAFGLHP